MDTTNGFDGQAYLAALEKAQPDELARMLVEAGPDQERLLRTYLGSERYRRMFAFALDRSHTRTRRSPRGNVVVIHGIMGGELTAMQGHTPVDSNLRLRQIWMKLPRLAFGDLRFLKLDRSGIRESDGAHQIQATGIMKNHYGEQLLSLAKHWNVRAFWFDWRKDLNEAAKELHLKLTEWFDKEPVHIVAHSMGGLVARTFIANDPDHWADLWDEETNGRRGGRLIMLGTPNHGSFAIPQIITGIEGTVRKLALLDLRSSLEELLDVINTFVGTYQMLPSPFIKEEYTRLYHSEAYGEIVVPQNHLNRAREQHASLREVVDPARMIYIAGQDRPTYSGIHDFTAFLHPKPARARRAYDVTLRGDGRVPHELGLIKDAEGIPVPTYYVSEGHGELPQNPYVLAALDELLMEGKTRRLAEEPSLKRYRSAAKEKEEARRRMEAVERENDFDEARVRAYVSLNQRRTRNLSLATTPSITHEERIAEEMVTRGFLSVRTAAAADSADVHVPFDPPRLRIRLICADIADESFLADGNPAVDAISVGHYQGVKPVHAEKALDRAISRAFMDPKAAMSEEEFSERELVITQLSERGTIRGDLGQPFLLPDFRDAAGGGTGRVVAIAGMGLPGRFGIPELTVLVRELVWALGCMGKRHLASVLIGTGSGNLAVDEAVSAWVRGFKHALTGKAERRKGVEMLTLVEYSPSRVLAIDAALRRVLAEINPQRLVLEYEPLDRTQKEAMQSQEYSRRMEALEREMREISAGGDAQAKLSDDGEPLEPTRLTVSLEGDRYRFGAITQDASVPEREVEIDPTLIDEANDRIATEWDAHLQRDHGRVLERLLIPQDLRPHLASSAPLVLLLDRTTARIHWEMVAQPDVSASLDRSRGDATAALTGGASRQHAADSSFYLGISRGFTRQLRTSFAPPPEPPPPPRRLLRVLLVVDPAEDAPLEGAREEGVEVAGLFERFNELYADGENRVEVVRLFGPNEASRLNVLSELTLRSYDVLHFAGHCYYDQQQPQASGWIFSDNEVLSARELQRIDRVPQFVFSNACESGVTALGTTERTADLAPSFAEAFFLRGVTNFVCTAWPIDDLAARTFARVLYANLLGIVVTDTEDGVEYVRDETFAPKPMHVAARQARLAILDSANGTGTWGAYQHYGNPYYRFFAPVRKESTSKRASSASGKASSASGKASSASGSASSTAGKASSTS